MRATTFSDTPKLPMADDDRDERTSTERREKPRLPAHRDVEVKIGEWYTARLLPHDVSESGVRLTIPGGATRGQKYSLTMRYGDIEITLLAQAQWAKQLEGDKTMVGLSFLATDDTTQETFRYFFDRLSTVE